MRTRRRTIPVTPAQEALLNAVIAFANLDEIRDTRQVEDLFVAALRAPDFNRLPRGEEKKYVRDRDEDLRPWLTWIAGGDAASLTKAGAAVAELLSAVHVGFHFDVARRRFEPQWHVLGVQAAYATGAALLLDRQLGLTKRFRRCRAPGCNRFTLHLRPRGRPRQHCSAKCSAAASSALALARVKKWRRKKEQAKEEKSVGTRVGKRPRNRRGIERTGVDSNRPVSPAVFAYFGQKRAGIRDG